MVGVLSQLIEEGAMAADHRRSEKGLVQKVLLDDPGFLRGIVESVLQELIEV
jgi:hypothetical protein